MSEEPSREQKEHWRVQDYELRLIRLKLHWLVFAVGMIAFIMWMRYLVDGIRGAFRHG